jgi:hypothetical protein
MDDAMSSHGGGPVGPVTGDAGQVGVGLALVVTVVALLAMAVIGIQGRVVVDRSRARTAADAAALAAVSGGRPAAEALAGANGGVVETYAVDGATVEVGVRVGTARAVSRAAPVPVGALGPASPTRVDLGSLDPAPGR